MRYHRVKSNGTRVVIKFINIIHLERKKRGAIEIWD